MTIRSLRSWIVCESHPQFRAQFAGDVQASATGSGDPDCWWRVLGMSNKQQDSDRIASDLRITPTGWPENYCLLSSRPNGLCFQPRCTRLSEFSEFLDRLVSPTSALTFQRSHSPYRLMHTLVANLRFAPFSRSPAWAVSAETDAAAHEVTSWPVTYMKPKDCQSLTFGKVSG